MHDNESFTLQLVNIAQNRQKNDGKALLLFHCFLTNIQWCPVKKLHCQFMLIQVQ